MQSRNRHTRIADRVSTRLKLKQLRLLDAISRHTSILHAAEELNISQPAATKLVRDLEQDFGVTLFDRTNRGVIPTVFGEALIRHGKLILAQISNAAQELDDLNEGSGGRVVVGTLLAASATLLPQAIQALHRQRPNVNVAVREGTNDILMPALKTGDLDFVVGRLPEYRHRAELVQERLLEERMAVVARSGHPFSGRRTLDLEDLAVCDWVLPPPDTTLRRQLDKEFHDRDLPPPNSVVESISFLTNRALLAGSDLVGVFPYHVIEHEVASGILTVLPIELALTQGPVGVSYRRASRPSPAAEAFLEILRTTADCLHHSE